MVSGRPLLIVTTPRRNSQRSQRKVAFYDSDGELMTISDEVCPIRMFKRCLPVTRYMMRRDLSKDDIPPSYVCFSSQEDCGPKG
jgi:hypothetical protein